MGLHPPVREDNCKAMQDQSDLGLLEEEWLAILGNISEDDKVGLDALGLEEPSPATQGENAVCEL